ncbi:MAG: hypothetical protein ACFE0Q_20805 [Anaerolineae bacterium]
MAKKQQDEQPVIAWEEMSILDAMEMLKRHDEASYINVIAMKIQNGKATDEDWERLDYLRSPDYQVEMIEQQARDMAQYVSSVPRSWFKKSAPAELDFDDAETFKMLQPQRFMQLHGMLRMNGAQQELATGN